MVVWLPYAISFRLPRRPAGRRCCRLGAEGRDGILYCDLRGRLLPLRRSGTDAAETIHRDWARSGEEMLRPFSSNAHLLSALDVEGEDVINTAWGANLPRLAAIKKKYDPTNFFRVNQNIKPV